MDPTGDSTTSKNERLWCLVIFISQHLTPASRPDLTLEEPSFHGNDMQEGDLNLYVLQSRSGISATREEPSHQASLMAGNRTPGPSDVPCLVESSTAHDELLLWITASSLGSIKFPWFSSYALNLVQKSQKSQKSLLPSSELSTSLKISQPPPYGRRSPICGIPTKGKLGFSLVGFSKIGPITLLKTKPKRCNPKQIFSKPRSVPNVPLSIFTHMLRRLWEKIDRRHQSNRNLPLLAWMFKKSMRTLPLDSPRSISYEPKRLKKNDLRLTILKTRNCTQSSRTFSEWHQQIYDWYAKFFQEESNHRISSTAGLYLGPLLASFPVRVSRMHGNSFFWMEISFIENFYRYCSSIFLPSLFSLMLCSYGSVERRLSSYLETTSMIWLCEYPFQILLQNSSIRSNLLVAAGLASARHEAKNPFLTPQNLLIMALYEIPESFVEMSLTHPSLACDMLLVSLCFRDSRDLSFKLFVCLIHLLYVCKIVLQNFVSYVPLFGLIE